MNEIQNVKLPRIKNSMVVIHDENYRMVHPQNVLVWQGEFYRWLKEGH